MRNAFAAAIVLCGSVASADVRSPFITLDHYDDSSKITGDLTYFDIDGNNDARILRFDLSGQFVDPGTHAGVYGDVPFAFVSSDSDDIHALGDISVGGLYNATLTPELGAVFHLGVLLPTVRNREDDQFAVLYSNVDRPKRLMFAFDNFALDAGAAFVLHTGQIFGRVEVGVTTPLEDNDLDSLLSLGIAGGYDFGTVVTSVELVGARSTDDNDDMISTLSFSALFRTGSLRPYVALGIPLTDDVSDDFNVFLSLGLTALL